MNGIDGYAIIVQEHFHLNSFNNSLYLFCNKYHNKIKILHYDDNGFWLYYKRIDTGTLKYPKDSSEIKEINFKQFRWLLDGLKVVLSYSDFLLHLVSFCATFYHKIEGRKNCSYKLSTLKDLSNFYEKPIIEYHHVLRGMNVLAENYDKYLNHLHIYQ